MKEKENEHLSNNYIQISGRFFELSESRKFKNNKSVIS